MKKHLTKEEFIEVVKKFGYNVYFDDSNCIAIYINNEICSNTLIAWFNVETKDCGCYDVRLDASGAICTRCYGRYLCSKEALKII